MLKPTVSWKRALSAGFCAGWLLATLLGNTWQITTWFLLGAFICLCITLILEYRTNRGFYNEVKDKFNQK